MTRFSRVELKLIVTAEQRAAVTDGIARRLRPDPHGDRFGAYPTVDLYYDSDDFALFWERWQELPSRRRLRIRVYGGGRETGATASFVEIKHRFEGRVYKRRVALPVDTAMALGRGELPTRPLTPMEDNVVREAQAFVRERRLRPAVIVRCHRQAFVGEGAEADLRLTFDRDIAFRTHDLVPRPDDPRVDGVVMGTDPCLLEIKVAEAVPRWLADLVTGHGCRLQSHSKYCRAVVTAGLVRPSVDVTPVAEPANRATQMMEATWIR